MQADGSDQSGAAWRWVRYPWLANADVICVRGAGHSWMEARPMWPHLTLLEFLILVGLTTAWRLPDWLRKLLELAEELRRFRGR